MLKENRYYIDRSILFLFIHHSHQPCFFLLLCVCCYVNYLHIAMHHQKVSYLEDNVNHMILQTYVYLWEKKWSTFNFLTELYIILISQKPSKSLRNYFKCIFLFQKQFKKFALIFTCKIFRNNHKQNQHFILHRNLKNNQEKKRSIITEQMNVFFFNFSLSVWDIFSSQCMNDVDYHTNTHNK